MRDTSPKPTSFLLVLLCCCATVLTACTDQMFSEMSEEKPLLDQLEHQESIEATDKLRHPQLINRMGQAGKDGAGHHLFVAFNVYEPDGVTTRVLDKYAITNRVLEEYGVTRRVLDEYGMTYAVLDQYGVTSRVLEAFGVTNGYFGTNGITDAVLASYGVTGRMLEEYGTTNRVLEEYGVTARVLEEYGNDFTEQLLIDYNITQAMLDAHAVTARMLEDYGITARLLEDYGITARILEDFGITSRMMEEYGITARMLEDYGITARLLEEYINAFIRTMRLKVRIDNGVPGMFLSLGTLPLNTFLTEISADYDIAFVEPDVPVQGPALAAVNDGPYTNELVPWGIDQVGGDGTLATGVEVYVLDSGVQPYDLNVVESKDFTALFVNRDVTTWDDTQIIEQPYYDPGTSGNPADETGHGTHVAGTIGALQNNQGVVGMAPGVNIHSLKVLTAQGQTDITTLMAAVDYVIVQKLLRPATPMVINLSLGMDLGATTYNVLDEAVKAAIENHITVVVSAGNSAADVSTFSPAHVAEAITVGAHDISQNMATFSNHGEGVDCLAPGVQVVSLSHDPNDVATGFAILDSGTSMAAPHATGVVALFLAENPQATPRAVDQALQQAARNDLQGLAPGTPNMRLTVSREKLTLPPFYNFAIAAHGAVGTYEETYVTVTYESPTARGNASVFSNAFFDPDNLNSTIHGFSYNAQEYVRDPLNPDPNDPTPEEWMVWMDQIAKPNYNPSNLKGHLYVDPIEIPLLNADAFLAKATMVSSGNETLKGHHDLGTEDHPAIWYIDGNLTIIEDVSFSGYGVFIIEGGVSINGNVTHTDGIAETRLGFYAENGITVRTEGLMLAAQFFTNNNMVLLGNTTIYGNLTAGGGVTFKGHGANTLYYREPPLALTNIMWP